MKENSITWRKSTLMLLFSSSAVSILLVSIGTLLVTRIYSPSEFGQYSFIFSLAILIAPLLTSTYEFFIVPSKTEEESLIIFRKGLNRNFKNLIFLLTVTLVAYLVLPIESLGINNYISQIILATVLASTYGIYNLLSQMALRSLDYNTISLRAPIQNGSIFTFQFILGNSALKNMGLIIGEFIGRFVTIAFISKRLKLKLFTGFQKSKGKSSIYLSKILSNTAATIFEILTGSSLFFYIYLTENINSSGNFALAQKLLTVPIILFGTTTAQYLFATGSQSVRHGNHMSRSELDRILIKLAIMSLTISAGAFLFGSLAIDLVLNSNWENVGSLMTIMSPYLIFTLIWAQLSFTFYTKEMWGSFFFFATFRLVLTSTVLIICYLNEVAISHVIHLSLGTNSIVSIAAIGFLRKKHAV